MWRLVSVIGLSLLVASCAPSAPPGWASGGSQLAFGAARWRGGVQNDVLVTPDGRVLQDGTVRFVVDAQGRVTDHEGEPVALVDEEGHLLGAGREFLGRVGLRNASPPWSGAAWLRIRSDGSVQLFGRGQIVAGGVWTGCSSEVLRTCTLVTHLFALEAVSRARPAVQYGIGMGMWY